MVWGKSERSAERTTWRKTERLGIREREKDLGK